MVDFSNVKNVVIPEGIVKSIAKNGTILWELKGGLPSEYQEVEYIQSSGTQYINTGFKPTGDTSIEFKLENPVLMNGVLYGAYNSGWSTGCGLYQNYNSRENNFWIHYYNNVAASGASISGIGIIKVDKGKFYLNGIYHEWEYGGIIPYQKKNFTLNYNMYIFCGNWYGSIKEPSKYKLYYFKIWDNDVLLRDYVPCYRKSDGVIGLYDLVNNQFYTNAGSGTFTKGNDI